MSFEIDLAVSKIVDALHKFDSARKLPPVQKRFLDGLVTKLKVANEDLSQLADYLDVSEVFGAAGDVVENQDFWEGLPAGYYINLDHEQARNTLRNKGITLEDNESDLRKRSEQLKQLFREKSKTLNQLYTATVDILSIRRFSADEINFAQEMGRKFQSLKWAWHEQFKRNIRLEDNKVSKGLLRANQPWAVQQIRQFLTLAHSANLIQGWDERSEKKDRTRPEGGVETVDSTVFDVHNHGLTVENVKFITGGWFEAYASEVVKDALGRRTDSYESYTEVEYWTKQAFGRDAHSDFDLLVRINDTVIMVECKSGHIKTDQTKKIRAKTNLLKDTLKKMGVTDFLFILVFSPLKPKVGGVNNALALQKVDELEKALTDLYDDGFVILEPNNLAPAFSGYLANREIPSELAWAPQGVGQPDSSNSPSHE